MGKRNRENSINEKKYQSSCDFIMVVLVIILTLFGLLMIFSASYYVALSKSGNPYTYAISDAEWLLLGYSGMIFFSMIDYHRFRKASGYFLIFSIILLGYVISPFGTVINNAARWIKIGPITFMPGEIVKTAFIFYLASFYSADPTRITKWTFIKGNSSILAYTVLSAFLIYKEPNLSTAGIVVLLVGGMMIVAGLKWIQAGLLTILGFLGFIGLLFTSKGAYMLDRVKYAFDPFKDPLGEGYQVIQGLYAFGSGGVLGVGLGKSIQKTLYLPEPQSDFILPIIGEELGYVTVLALMAVYLILIWRIVRIAIKAPDYMGTLLASGIALHLSLQVILNIAVVSATFFPTGVVLPFISLGGNATCLFLSEIGVAVNISRQIKREEEVVPLQL